MKRLLGILGAGVFLAPAFIAPAAAQQVNNYCWVSNGPPVQWAPCSAANPLAITGAGGGGLSVVDSAAWTTGVSPFTPSGGVFNDAATLSTGTQGTFRLTTKRAQIIDVDSVGNQLHTDITSATPAGANTIGSVKIVDTAGTNLATVKPASTAPVATDTSVVTALNPNSPGIIATGGSTTALSVPVNMNSQYPVNSVTTAPAPITASATGTTASVAATLAGVASKTTFICGMTISSSGATTPTAVTVTVAGTITGTMNFIYSVVGVATDNQVPMTVPFSPCVPASAANTGIVVTQPGVGAGATAAAVTAWGYQL